MERVTQEQFISAKGIINRYRNQMIEELRDMTKYSNSQSRYFHVKKTDSFLNSNLHCKVLNCFRGVIPRDKVWDFTIEDFFNCITKRSAMQRKGVGKKAMLELIDLSIHAGINFKN